MILSRDDNLFTTLILKQNVERYIICGTKLQQIIYQKAHLF